MSEPSKADNWDPKNYQLNKIYSVPDPSAFRKALFNLVGTRLIIRVDGGEPKEVLLTGGQYDQDAQLDFITEFPQCKLTRESPLLENECSCGNEASPNLHTCPFLDQVHDDSEECNCCENCEENCRMKI